MPLVRNAGQGQHAALHANASSALPQAGTPGRSVSASNVRSVQRCRDGINAAMRAARRSR